MGTGTLNLRKTPVLPVDPQNDKDSAHSRRQEAVAWTHTLSTGQIRISAPTSALIHRIHSSY